MRKTIDWLLLGFAVLAVIGLMIWARGPKNHEGDEMGTHGTNVYVHHTHVIIVP
jgi:hypothetical protein